MPEIIQIKKKYICRPIVVAELRKMCEESGLNPWDVIYGCFLEKMDHRIKMRSSGGNGNITALKIEVTRIMEKYEREGLK